jgi:hypothetical protein
MGKVPPRSVGRVPVVLLVQFVRVSRRRGNRILGNRVATVRTGPCGIGDVSGTIGASDQSHDCPPDLTRAAWLCRTKLAATTSSSRSQSWAFTAATKVRTTFLFRSASVTRPSSRTTEPEALPPHPNRGQSAVKEKAQREEVFPTRLVRVAGCLTATTPGSRALPHPACPGGWLPDSYGRGVRRLKVATPTSQVGRRGAQPTLGSCQAASHPDKPGGEQERFQSLVAARQQATRTSRVGIHAAPSAGVLRSPPGQG